MAGYYDPSDMTLIKTKLYVLHMWCLRARLLFGAQASNENWYPLLEAMEMIIAAADEQQLCNGAVSVSGSRSIAR